MLWPVSMDQAVGAVCWTPESRTAHTWTFPRTVLASASMGASIRSILSPADQRRSHSQPARTPFAAVWPSRIS